MRGRMKLTGIIAVVAVVALAIGVSVSLLNHPASADANDDASAAYAEEAHAPGEGMSFEEALSKKAVSTVEVHGATFGVLENGETFGLEGPQYVDEEGNLQNNTPDWVGAFTSDDKSGWMYAKDYSDAREHDAKTRDEALAMMANPPEPIEIPIYAEPGGGEIIGYTYYYNS